MRIGTTPTHTFEMPTTMVGNIKSVEIIYSQKNNIVLRKSTEDITINDNLVSVTLTQEDTFKFADGVNAEIQVRVLDKADNAFVSNIMCVSCDRCLTDEVLT